MLYTVYHISTISLLFTHIRTYTAKIHFRHMNMHENHMPDLIFTLPELKTKQNDEFFEF